MFCSVREREENTKNTSLDIGSLEQNFVQLPAEGKLLFKEFLQNLVAMQKTMAGAFSADNAESSSNEG